MDTKWQYASNAPNLAHFHEKLASKSWFLKKIFFAPPFCRPRLRKIDFLFKNIDFNIDIFIYPLSKITQRWKSIVISKKNRLHQIWNIFSSSMVSIPRLLHLVFACLSSLVRHTQILESQRKVWLSFEHHQNGWCLPEAVVSGQVWWGVPGWLQ